MCQFTDYVLFDTCIYTLDYVSFIIIKIKLWDLVQQTLKHLCQRHHFKLSFDTTVFVQKINSSIGATMEIVLIKAAIGN